MLDGRTIDLITLEAEERFRMIMQEFELQLQGGRDAYRNGLVLPNTGAEQAGLFPEPNGMAGELYGAPGGQLVHNSPIPNGGPEPGLIPGAGQP